MNGTPVQAKVDNIETSIKIAVVVSMSQLELLPTGLIAAAEKTIVVQHIRSVVVVLKHTFIKILSAFKLAQTQREVAQYGLNQGKTAWR